MRTNVIRRRARTALSTIRLLNRLLYAVRNDVRAIRYTLRVRTHRVENRSINVIRGTVHLLRRAQGLLIRSDRRNVRLANKGNRITNSNLCVIRKDDRNEVDRRYVRANRSKVRLERRLLSCQGRFNDLTRRAKVRRAESSTTQFSALTEVINGRRAGLRVTRGVLEGLYNAAHESSRVLISVRLSLSKALS